MSRLEGKVFCFTGKSTVPRSQLAEMAEEQGATVKNSIVNGLDYLVMIDPNSATVKTKKAREQGVEIISEQEFFVMVQE